MESITEPIVRLTVLQFSVKKSVTKRDKGDRFATSAGSFLFWAAQAAQRIYTLNSSPYAVRQWRRDLTKAGVC